MSRRIVVVVAIVAAGVCGLVGLGTFAAGDRFPHPTHDGLFPDGCRTCHAGISAGDRTAFFSVTADVCNGCHTEAGARQVEWTPPAPRPGNLIFDHASHVGGRGIDCLSCHREPDATGAMDVVKAQPERCLDCHQASSHLAPEARCATCHQPVAKAASLTVDQIRSFPKPADHADAGWISKHGAPANGNPARCATCHSRETCRSCHLNAGIVGSIRGLEGDSRVAQVQVIAPRWPKPASHDAPDWSRAHGTAAHSSIQSCGNCHVRKSCATCHGTKPPAGVESLPVAGKTGPQGIDLAGMQPPGHGPGFRLNHGVAAASGAAECSSCHSAGFCSDCHNPGTAPGFHPKNYLQRHAAEAWARDTECSSCHSTEIFCRSCHLGAGLAQREAGANAYHDAEPLWILNHGRAARQGLESCASCHQQTDCMECHSAKSGLGIKPHGSSEPDGGGNEAMCRRCHTNVPGD